jgi:hypothetical protein
MKADGEADFLGVEESAPNGGNLLRNGFESTRLFGDFICDFNQLI